jgi:AAA domain
MTAHLQLVELPPMPTDDEIPWTGIPGHQTTPADDAERDTSHLDAESPAPAGLPAECLADAVDVAREGQRIEADGIPYLWNGIIPALGFLLFLIAFAKVGKTTFAQAVAAAIAMGRTLLDRATQRARVLIIAAEDPPEYVAWLARHLDVEPGWLTFYRGPILLSADGLDVITQTVTTGGYGLVLIASWQAVVRGLVRDENDNAGAVCIVESVKAAARRTGVPWLVDAHSGKGEDQADDADPSRAMRGASSAAGSADASLSLRYANGTFGTRRKLSGRGRFINLEPLVMDFDAATSTYTLVGDTKSAGLETTWQLIQETGAVGTDPRTAGAIAKAAGMVGTKTDARHVAHALANRDGVLKGQEMRNGHKAWVYWSAPSVEA